MCGWIISGMGLIVLGLLCVWVSYASREAPLLPATAAHLHKFIELARTYNLPDPDLIDESADRTKCALLWYDEVDVFELDFYPDSIVVCWYKSNGRGNSVCVFEPNTFLTV